jgi:hypothetical protein
MASIEMARTSSKQAVENFTARFQGQTYMNLQVTAAPAGGEWVVSISTTYDASHNELQDMINGIMFYETSRS